MKNKGLVGCRQIRAPILSTMGYAGIDRFTSACLLGQLFSVNFDALSSDAIAYLQGDVQYAAQVQYFTRGDARWEDCAPHYRKYGHITKAPPSPSF